MARYDVRILNGLLDSYENSRLQRGENKVAVHISFPFTKAKLPEYFDESSLAYDDIHAVVKELERKGIISVAWKEGKKGHIIKKVLLNEGNVDTAYDYLKRIPKANFESEHLKLLEAWERRSEGHPVTGAFISYLKKRIQEGKSVKEFVELSDLDRTERILSAISFVEENEEPCYIREFSIRHFGDSKTFEAMSGIFGKIMRRFRPEFADMDIYAILAEYAIYHTPDYVYLKGEGQILFDGKEDIVWDLSWMNQGIGISGADLKKVRICGREAVKKVITVENLTTFFRWQEEGSLIIYLGGYHNSVRRELLRMVYREIPHAVYLHFGDIDVGGFEIYRDLCDKTGIPFRTYHMGIEELKLYAIYTKKLTENDQRRLKLLIEKEKEKNQGNIEVLRYMEQNNVKLEQEAQRPSAKGYDKIRENVETQEENRAEHINM